MPGFYLLCLAASLLEVPILSATSREETSRYRTLEANSTLLKLLLAPNRDESMRSEIFDMLHSRDFPPSAPPARSDAPDFPQDTLAVPKLPQAPDQQTEQIQSPEEMVKKDTLPEIWRAGLGGSRRTFQGPITGIMLGLTCIIVLLAYVSLVAYRRYILIKTGNKHELLRNEDSTAETRIDL